MYELIFILRSICHKHAQRQPENRDSLRMLILCVKPLEDFIDNEPYTAGEHEEQRTPYSHGNNLTAAALAGAHADNHCKHDNSDYVIDYRCTDNKRSELRFQLAHLRKSFDGYTHRGCGEYRSDEKRLVKFRRAD